jgi:hypothetical protein
MCDNLIFISVFNYGAIEMAKNHLKSLRNQGITNHRSYVTDSESYIALKSLGYQVHLIENDDIVKTSANFGTPEFNNMSYVRYHVIKHLLQKGYDVWYMDVDTVILQNLIPIYVENKSNGFSDIMFQTDINMPCTGCMLIFNGERSMMLVDAIVANQNNDANDQLIVNAILKQYPEMVRHANFSMFMFPNGLLYFGEDFVKCPDNYRNIKDAYLAKEDKVVHFVHANWMVGEETKTKAFQKYGLWFV